MGLNSSAEISRFDLTAQNVIDQCKHDVDLKSLHILVTGATSGIGFETARVLANNGAHVYLMGRQKVKVDECIEQINQALNRNVGSGSVESVICDLNSLKRVKEFAQLFLSGNKPLNILILNAGLFNLKFSQTADGLEQVMGVNHIAHAYLTQLLMPRLIKDAPSRIVVISAKLHEGPPMDYEAFAQQCTNSQNAKKSWSIFRSYQQSKLANVLYARAISLLYKEQRITTYSLHPGVISTNLGGNKFLASLFTMVFKKKSIEQGAATTVFCAIKPGLETETGRYFDDSTVTDLADKWTVDEVHKFFEWTETVIKEKM